MKTVIAKLGFSLYLGNQPKRTRGVRLKRREKSVRYGMREGSVHRHLKSHGTSAWGGGAAGAGTQQWCGDGDTRGGLGKGDLSSGRRRTSSLTKQGRRERKELGR